MVAHHSGRRGTGLGFLLVVLIISWTTHADAARIGGPVKAPPNTHVVGGANADIRAYPYQVALFDAETREFFCGGAIISNRAILTAQHCFQAVEQIGFVGVGKTSMSEFTIADQIPIESIALYPQYPASSEGTRGKDAAILFLANDINTTGTDASPIQMASPGDQNNHKLQPGVKAWISGWGTTAYDSQKFPDTLQAAQVRIVRNEFGIKSGMGPLFSDQITAGQFPGKGRVDTCQGDSGGPLVVKTKTNLKLLAGITSWGIGCADGRHPGVYARVPSFFSWIKRILAAYDYKGFHSTTFLVASDFVLGAYAKRRIDVYVPRGLRAVHFVLEMNSTRNVSTGNLEVSYQDSYYSDCVSLVGRAPRRCTFIAPLEGIYTVITSAENAALSGLRLSATFEGYEKPVNMTENFNNVTLSALGRRYFVGIAALPMTNVSVELIGVNNELQVLLGEGVQPPVQAAESETKTASAYIFTNQSAVSIDVKNSLNRSAMVDLIVRFYAYPAFPLFQRQAFSGTQIPPHAPLKFKPAGELKEGSEFSVSIYMVAGTAGVRVIFGDRLEWQCFIPPGKLYICGGVVPNRSRLATVYLDGEAVNYRVVVSFEPKSVQGPRGLESVHR